MGTVASIFTERHRRESRAVEVSLTERRQQKQKVTELVDALQRMAQSGRLLSLVFIAEQEGKPQVLDGIVGRLRDDPLTTIGHLQVMQHKLAGFVADPGDE